MTAHHLNLFGEPFRLPPQSRAAPLRDPLVLPRLRAPSTLLPGRTEPREPAQAGETNPISSPSRTDPPPAADAAADEAADSALKQPSGGSAHKGLPSARSPTIPSLPAAPGGSLSSVLQVRLEQIEKWGHTPDKDRAAPIAGFLDRMLHELASGAGAALEDHQFRLGLARIRKRLVKLAALALATIDRIDAELSASSSEAVGRQGSEP